MEFKQLQKLQSIGDHPTAEGARNQAVLLSIERDRLVKELDRERAKLADLEGRAAEAIGNGKAFPVEEIEKAQAAAAKLASILHG